MQFVSGPDALWIGILGSALLLGVVGAGGLVIQFSSRGPRLEKKKKYKVFDSNSGTTEVET